METCVLMLGGDCWHLLTLANLGNLFGLYGIVWVSPGTCRVSPCVTSMSPRLWPQRSGADAGAPGAVGGPSAPGEVHDAPWADGAAGRPSEFCVAGREEKEIEEIEEIEERKRKRKKQKSWILWKPSDDSDVCRVCSYKLHINYIVM